MHTHESFAFTNSLRDQLRNRNMKMIYVLHLCIFLSFIIAVSANNEDRKVFIAYMGSLPQGEYSASLHHNEILKEITGFASKSLVRSYQRSFNGFAAYLSHEEQQKLAGYEGIVSVFPSQKRKLQTTRSWDFMGLPLTTKRSPIGESNTIVGVIDSGIWPESDSFSDEGLGPIPSKWKGECNGGKNFTCNRKIIGARFYGRGVSARDYRGHGTHVASVIAGNPVKNANYYGIAQGTARGGVPSARLAAYKVCDIFCEDKDIMTAFDDAIADGVDIISISLGSDKADAFTSDPIAIGSFHAMEKGVLTVGVAGNEGPRMFTLTGFAPWILTVAASNTDRKIVDKVLLGDDTTLVGTSINAFPSSSGQVPLVYGHQVTTTCSETDARNCLPWCLDPILVEQNVVICDNNLNVAEVKEAGAFGCIIPDMGSNVSVVRSLPVAALNTNDTNLLITYQSSTTLPNVKIFKSEAIHNPAAPLVAPFSSRGPSRFVSDIIKPDVMAPGVEILAAYSPMASPSIDNRSVKYLILSGTSMACPHVAAAAAFLKSFHPNWSSSAIKSALMTTAWEIDPKSNLGAEFAYGSGHIDPQKAKDPGLVYETHREDYLKIWCNISQSEIAGCRANGTVRELNYPSMAVQVDMKSTFVVKFPRTVTNVGKANSTYVASIKGSKKLHVIVEPNMLQFTTLNQKKSFVVTIRGKRIYKSPMERVSLLWTDGVHSVRSPIVVYGGAESSGAATPPISCKTSVIFFLGIIIYSLLYW